MFDILQLTYAPELAGKIAYVEDKSNEWVNKLLVMFNNNNRISIIQGEGVYGNEDAPYEIAIIDKNDNFFDLSAEPILGYCTQEIVLDYIHLVANLPYYVTSSHVCLLDIKPYD